ncbi:MAG: hypothetical protein AB7G11_04275 [Phycisphaerales bacterium]
MNHRHRHRAAILVAVASLLSGATPARAIDAPDSESASQAPSAGPPRSGDEPAPRTIEPGPRHLGRPEPAASRPLGLSADATRPGPSLFRTVGSLVLVLGSILAVALLAKTLLRRKQALAVAGVSRAPAGVLEILGRYPIGSGITLILLKVDRRVLLLSQTGSASLPLRRASAASLSTLCEISDAESVASILTKTQDADGQSIAAKFRELMGACAAGLRDADAADASANDAPAADARITTRPLSVSTRKPSAASKRTGGPSVEVTA